LEGLDLRDLIQETRLQRQKAIAPSGKKPVQLREKAAVIHDDVSKVLTLRNPCSVGCNYVQRRIAWVSHY
jgi:hypothetical protein